MTKARGPSTKFLSLLFAITATRGPHVVMEVLHAMTTRSGVGTIADELAASLASSMAPSKRMILLDTSFPHLVCWVAAHMPQELGESADATLMVLRGLGRTSGDSATGSDCVTRPVSDVEGTLVRLLISGSEVRVLERWECVPRVGECVYRRRLSTISGTQNTRAVWIRSPMAFRSSV
jgi:hypothetical protein